MKDSQTIGDSDSVSQKNRIAAELRERAIAKAKDYKLITDSTIENMSLEKFQIIIHELEVHQIELELQNDELRKVHQDLDEEKNKYLELYESVPVGCMLLDSHKIVTQGNKATYKILDINRHELLNSKITNYIHRDDQDLLYLKLRELETSDTSISFRIRMYNYKKDMFWAMIIAETLNKGNEIFTSLIMTDVTNQVKMEEALTFMSYHDQLTGLFNRRYYVEKVHELNKEENLPLSMIMGDVNGLKLINDTLGHAEGDKILIKASRILKKTSRKNDVLARLGGDGFIILLPNTSYKNAQTRVSEIVKIVSKEQNPPLDLSISFGVATKVLMNQTINLSKEAEDEMFRQKLFESTSQRSKSVDLILKTLYEKNKRELFHSKRVSEICGLIALKMDFSQEEIKKIKTAGLLHDIGKIAIPENILNSTKPLNESEWKANKKHPEIGYRILSSASEFSEIADYVLEHHEQWDGKGYPKGLKGKEILVVARIICLADAYDAMTSDRPYGRAINKTEAYYEIEEKSGSQFDPEIVKIFLDKVLKKIN